MNTMMEVAMERCETARCAIQTMGDLATELGFYGSDPGADGGGEAVTIADAVSETWVFHVLADDTGTSAIWAAQVLTCLHNIHNSIPIAASNHKIFII